MPLANTAGAASVKGAGGEGLTINGPNFIASQSNNVQQPASQSDSNQGITVDAWGNIYTVGRANNYGFALLTKYSPNGQVIWQRSFQNNGAGGGNHQGIAVDTAGNIYVAGQYYNGYWIGSLLKYSANGLILWQVQYANGSSTSYPNYAASVAVDGSNNVYVTGYYGATSTTVFAGVVFKYTSSGVYQWQRYLTQSGSVQGNGISLDKSGNIYVGGVYNNGTDNYGFLAQYNASGTLAWQRSLYNTNTSVLGVTTDSNGYIYVVGYYFNTFGFVAKYNSSGVIQWKRGIGRNLYNTSVSVDNLGSVYVTGNDTNSTPNQAYLLRYSDAGVLKWQKAITGPSTTLTGAAGNTLLYGVASDTTGNVYVTGQIGNGLPTTSTTTVAGPVSSYNVAGNTFTFATAGTNAYTGPSLSTLLSYYNTTQNPWLTNTAYFNEPGTTGIQYWTAPATGTYTITAAGAPGARGGTPTTTSYIAGRGAIVQATVTLTAGTVYKILVGQPGSAYYDGGGGGGTFMTDSSNNPIIVAGGGGGTYYNYGIGSQSQVDGQTTNNGSVGYNGGTGGSGGGGGGSGNGLSGGGGGLLTDSTGNTNGYPYMNGKAFVNGGTGGYALNNPSYSFGGFGGGGGSNGNGWGGGGGGGYSGGAGGDTSSTNNAGGGGSYIISTATNVSTSNGQYNSSSTFNGTAITSTVGYNGTVGAYAVYNPGYLTIAVPGSTTTYVGGAAGGGTNILVAKFLPDGTSFMGPKIVSQNQQLTIKDAFYADVQAGVVDAAGALTNNVGFSTSMTAADIGFESGTGNWGAGSNWTATQDSTYAQSGTYSLKCTRANTTAGFGYVANSAYSMVANQTYQYYGYVYADSTSAGKTYTIMFQYPNGTRVSSNFTPTLNTWNLVSLNVPATTTAGACALYITDDAQGSPSTSQSIWLDQMVFLPGAETPSFGGASETPSYSFSTFTFTSGGTSGPTGPALSTLLSSYSTSTYPWLNNTSYFTATGGIQYWTVPSTAVYRITALGAGGYSGNGTAGYGASMRGDFTLSKGQVIKILVGQCGIYSSYGGGGGGTFVATNTNTALVVAGGGASTSPWSSGRVDALTTNSGPNGGSGSGSCAPGGAGFSGNGTSASCQASFPYSFTNGGNGSTSCNGGGGFGGGAATDGCCCGQSGAGGGYTGGNANQTPGNSGSYNSGTNQINSTGANAAGNNGSVTVTLVSTVSTISTSAGALQSSGLGLDSQPSMSLSQVNI